MINKRSNDGSGTDEEVESYLSNSKRSKRSSNNQRDYNDGRSRNNNDEDDTLKYVYLNAFGNGMHLNLKRNEELHHKLKSLKLITAESSTTSSRWAPSHEGVRYSESSIQGEGEESVGVPYHDDHHVAAVIVSTGPDGQVTLVSCPSLISFPFYSIHRHIHSPPPSLFHPFAL